MTELFPVQWDPFLCYETGYPDKHLILSGESFQRMLNFLSSSPVIAFDTETSGIEWFKHARACGIGFAGFDPANNNIHKFYVPFRHDTGERQLDLNVISPGIKAVLGDESKMKIAHHLKFDEHMVRCEGWEVRGPRYDTMIMARLFDENRRIGLEYRAATDLGRSDADVWKVKVKQRVLRCSRDLNMKIGDYLSKFGYSQVHIPLAGTYACFDVDFTMDLFQKYEKLGLSRKYQRIWDTEMALTEVLCDMEEFGLPIDVEYLENLRVMLRRVQKELEAIIWYKLNRRPFNLNSDEELRTFLLNDCKMILTKLTKGGKKKEAVYSVDREVLDSFADRFPVLNDIGEWRDAEKLASTYTDSILKRLDSGGVLHPDFNQVGTNCMPAGELVLTDRSYLPIEDVCAGDMVIAHTGEIDEVVSAGKTGVSSITCVSLDNGLTLKTTPGTGYYCKDGEWVVASHLRIGQEIQIHSNPELWRKILDWEDFEISDWGRVRNIKTWHILHQYKKNIWGHLKVNLYRNGAQKRGVDRKDFSVHRLLLEAFCGLGAGLEARHLSGISWENTIDNLEWGTSLDNSADAITHGSMSHSGHSTTKLNQEIADLIRATPREVASDHVMAERYGVSRTLVRDVRTGKRWVRSVSVGKRAIFKTARVVAVEKIRQEMTHGLQVKQNHSHVTGGIVTHNTGRFSAKQPNLQNQPVDNNDRAIKFSGKSLEDGGVDPWSIRRAYKNRGTGWVRLFWDFSQIELRVLAHYSKDPVMVKAFLDGEDIHSRTSLEVFGIADKAHRGLGKTINFGLSYGLTAKGFAHQAKIPEDDADAFLRKFFERYRGVAEFREVFWKQVCTQGKQFQNLFGRPRRLELINSRNSFERGRAERQAIATLIQGTAAEIMKESLVRLGQWFKKEKLQAYLVSTIHDEAQVDCHVDIMAQIAKGMQERMEDFPEFAPIPILADGEYSITNWSEKKDLPK